MAMAMDEINEIQIYLQMYDKGLVSKKTVLAKIGIKWEDEKKDIKKDIKFDTERFSPNYPSDDASCCCKGEPGGESLDIILDVGKNSKFSINADRLNRIDAKIKEMDELSENREISRGSLGDGYFELIQENRAKIKIINDKFGAMATCLDKIAQSINKVREVVDLEVKKLDEKAVIPAYAHKGDAGFDLSAIVLEKTSDSYTDKTTILPGQKYIARTGLAFAVPQGYELQVRPRSGLAYKHGITVINSPGTVDSGYRGEVMVILLNTGTEPFEIKTGDRIAQAVINKLPKVIIREVEDLDKTERGSGGFGSTGK